LQHAREDTILNPSIECTEEKGKEKKGKENKEREGRGEVRKGKESCAL